MRSPMVFVLSPGQSGTHLISRLCSLLGLARGGVTAHYNLSDIRAPERPAYEMQEFDPHSQILAGSYWPGLLGVARFEEMFRKHLHPGQFGAAHMLYTPAAGELFERLGLRILLIVREPTAWAYSHARAIGGETTITERLEKGVFGWPANSIPMGQLPMVDVYHRHFGFLRHPNTMLVKFEDLVGAKGGGSDEALERAVIAIAKHVGIELKKQTMQTIRDDLFGHGPTFRRGQVDLSQDVQEFFERPDVKPRILDAGALYGYRWPF